MLLIAREDACPVPPLLAGALVQDIEVAVNDGDRVTAEGDSAARVPHHV